MKILLVSHSRHLGGAQHVLLSLAKGLKERHKVTVACPGLNGYLPNKLQFAGIEVCSHNHMPQADVVVTNTITLRAGIDFAEKHKIPHVWYAHETLPDYSGITGRGIAISEYVKRHMRAGGCRDVKVVYSGIPIPESAEITADPVVITAGGLCQRKDQKTLLRAAKLVLEVLPKTTFISRGDSWDYKYAVELQRERKRLGIKREYFLFHRATEEIDAFYRAGRVFVSSPVSEPFGLAILEAMSYGLPVVTTRSGGPEEIINQGVNGYLCDVGDYGGLAASVIGLLKNAATVSAVGNAARDTVIGRFGCDRYIDDFLKAIH